MHRNHSDDFMAYCRSVFLPKRLDKTIQRTGVALDNPTLIYVLQDRLPVKYAYFFLNISAIYVSDNRLCSISFS